jgi:predicted RNase H-like nuclease (RuvC/YqgF family)
MKARTIIELLTLSSNLYLIAKDQEFFEKLKGFADNVKTNPDTGEEHAEGDDDLLHRMMDKARQAKEELEKKMEDVAARVYKSMHITHTDELQLRDEQIAKLQKELALAEARINILEQKLGLS